MGEGMTWKTVYQGEVEQVTKDTSGLVGKQALFSLGLDGFVGKRVRVTVEQEVSECCEKWRGAMVTRLLALRDPDSWMNVGYQARFCPECGRKL